MIQGFKGLGPDLWRLIFLLLAATIIRSVTIRVREGSFSLYGTAVERAKNPISFWCVVITALIGAVGFIVFAFLG